MVYFISDGRGYIKIGVADNVNGRLRQLQCANATKLEVLKILKIRRFDDYTAEQTLHKMLDKYRVMGEWFTEEGVRPLLNLSEDDLKQKIKEFRKSAKDFDIEYQRPTTIAELEGIIKNLKSDVERLSKKRTTKDKKQTEEIKKLRENNKVLHEENKRIYGLLEGVNLEDRGIIRIADYRT